MTTPGSPGINLTLDLTVLNGKTMTRHHVGERSILTFHNDSEEPLVVTCTSGQAPFLDGGCGNPVESFTVPAGGTKAVRIAEAVTLGQSFVYSARIGNSEPEDPIIILDRR
jgi:hypothetical protein